MGICNSVMRMICGEQTEPETSMPAVTDNTFEGTMRIRQERIEEREKQILAEEDAARRKAEAELDEFKRDDANHLQEIRDGWKPEVRVIDYPIGTFIGYGEKEHPARYIENIRIVDAGGNPHLKIHVGPDYVMPLAKASYRAVKDLGVIEFSMTSGAKHRILENRHKIPFVHEALVHAWKNAKS